TQAQRQLQTVRGNRTLGSAIANEVPKIPGQVQGAVHALNPLNAKNDNPQGDNGGLAPGVTTPQFSKPLIGTVKGDVGAVTQQLNPLTLMNTPQHLYRTWADIEAKHGPAAMVEAMIPSLAG